MQYWLGINDDVIEGEWRYTDTGELTTYSDWAPNEPDNTHGLDGNGRIVLKSGVVVILDKYEQLHFTSRDP